MFFEEKVRSSADKYHMFENIDTVYAALSGGADSVSMLLSLKSLSEEYGFSLAAIHVNHHIRGEESDRDMRFCEDLCQKNNIPLEIYHVEAISYSKEHGLSLEEGARELRYEIFENIPEGSETATAHTLNDSAETVIFNLSRGTGIKGLAGIPPVRGKIIRPLIECTRNEVEEYLAKKGQTYVTDSTNLSNDYSRNKIRHEIIPLLEELHGGFAENIRRMTASLAEDHAFLEEYSASFEGDDLRPLHAAIRKRIIIAALQKHNSEINNRRVNDIDRIILKGSGKINLSGDVYAVVKNGRLEIVTLRSERMIFEDTPVKIGENPFLCDKIVIINENNSEIPPNNGIVNKIFTYNRLDCDKIQGDVIIRNRRNGDSYQRVNRDFTSSLKKLMNEKYPLSERDLVPILADSCGIIWVEGFGAAERVKTDENTKNIWDIRVVKK